MKIEPFRHLGKTFTERHGDESELIWLFVSIFTSADAAYFIYIYGPHWRVSHMIATTIIVLIKSIEVIYDDYLLYYYTDATLLFTHISLLRAIFIYISFYFCIDFDILDIHLL